MAARNSLPNWVSATEVYFDEIAKAACGVFDVTHEQLKSIIQKPSAGDEDLVIPVGAVNKFKKKIKPADVCEKYAGLIAEAVNKEFISNVGFNLKQGFITFKINKLPMVKSVLTQIHADKENYGKTNLGQGKNVIVEYSSPNIAKPFHAGHLRSTILGNFLKNVYNSLGYNVTSINYLGDWGKQYGLLALGYEKYGSEEELNANPIAHLFDVYVKINKDLKAEEGNKPQVESKKERKKKEGKQRGEDEKAAAQGKEFREEEKKEEAKKDEQEEEKGKEEEQKGDGIDDRAREYFLKMEEGDPEALATWQRFRDLSIVKYKAIYERLGMKFDVYSGESQFQKEMMEALKLLQEKNMLTELEGAEVITLDKYKLGKCMVRKKNGSTLYITRDIAAAISRYEQYQFDEMIYVVAAPQNHHFKQLFKVLELMGFDWAKKCKHVDFGLVKGMSTRKGDVKFLEDILDEAKKSNFEIMAKNEDKFKQIDDPMGVSDIVGLSAVFIQDLKAKRVKDYEFSWDRMLAEHGDTGPYIQYAHVRMASIERKCSDVPLACEVDFNLLEEPVAQELAYLLCDFPIVINAAKLSLEPSGVVTYALKICRLFSSGVDQLKVKGSPLPLAQARLLLFSSTRIVLNSCLKLLGLTPLERM
mmetsp:Transcript_24614/g.38369  ORF Transcript_24614/g.38369 Transcript_24614/m.38369 type:complete len:644 (-) Transcript_24614:169-2100(-)